MYDINKKQLEEYFQKISENHQSNIDDSGFEVNDRAIFKKEFLALLGYELKHILDDVSQKVGDTSKIPDIRLYGENENKTKNSHSQFVIETKNYGLLDHNIDNIDFKQLKNYIISNKSKIRVICSTDYVSLFVFSATEIKKKLNLNAIDSINKYEENIFKNNVPYQIFFDNLKERDIFDLKNLSYNSVFKKHRFITSTEYEDTNSIKDTNVRNNFISNLFTLMKVIVEDVRYDFYDILNKFFEKIKKIEDNVDFKDLLEEEIREDDFMVMKSFLIWGSEMNYIVDIITDTKSKITLNETLKFFNNKDYQDAFILTSVYNLINKTFFIRILEDHATDTTKFISGEKNYRYLSNGILDDKVKESEESLIKYLIDVYEFSKPDLKQYSFLLKKDIYSWVLDWIDRPNLITFIRLFNDISFKKLDQDILGDIYEHYLEQDKTDGEKSFRRLLGQYYTPKPIVRFMWYLVRDVLNKTQNRDLYEENQTYLDILDPAYGSGTFLYEVILHINQVAVKKEITEDGKVWGFIKKRNGSFKIEDHLFGFELNPLSKSIADINLFFGLIQAHGSDILNKLPVKTIKLFRTNSFELDIKKKEKEATDSLFHWLSDDIKYSLEERKDILDAKMKKYDIIIANPPYGHITPNRFMQNELIPFAYAENNFDKKGKEISFDWNYKNRKGKVPASEKNVGNVRDMYVCFFGVANHLVNKSGIICFITSNSYLTLHTYKWFRKFILENYTIYYLINFNYVSEQSNSMFSPEAGIATVIIVMEKNKPSENHYIKYLDLSNISSIKYKYDSFCNIQWINDAVNKNDILNFKLKENLDFIHVLQKNFLNNYNYVLTFSANDEINMKIEGDSLPITEYSLNNKKYSGLFLGDVSILSDKNISLLKNKIETNIFFGDISKISAQLLREKLEKNMSSHPKIFKDDYFLTYIPEGNFEHYYYSDSLVAYWDDSLLVRAGEEDNVFNENKLIVVEKRDKNKFLGYVTKGIEIQNARRNYYILADDRFEKDYLYGICAIINSKLIQFYYKTRLKGSRLIPIKNISKINKGIFSKLIQNSKLMHVLRKDQKLFNNDCLYFESLWFKENISPEYHVVSILEGSDLWNVVFSSDLVHEYYVAQAKINSESKNEIILNSETKIVCKSEKIAKELFKKYLKEYDANLSENDILINLTEFYDPEKYQSLITAIDNKCSDVENEIDNLVFEIYEIKKEERETIIDELNN